jgi:hypothetical protein
MDKILPPKKKYEIGDKMKLAKINEDLKTEFLKGDIFSQLITNRLRWHRWVFPVVMISITFVMFATPVLINSYFNSYHILPNDIGNALISFIVRPFLVWYFLWLPQKMWTTLERLLENQAIPKIKTSKYFELINNMAKAINGKPIQWIALLISVSLTYGMVATQPPVEYWFSRSSPLWWFSEIPLGFIAFYALTLTIFRLVGFQNFLSKVYKNMPINVHPWHPDRAGGLGSIGELFLTCTYIVLAVILFIIGSGLPHIQEYMTNHYFPWEFISILAILPIFEFLIFFGMLYTTHNVMKKEYLELLNKLDREFNTEIKEKTKAEETSTLLKTQLDLYLFLERNYPRWPIKTGTIKRFYGTMSASILPFVISIFQNALVSLINFTP